MLGVEVLHQLVLRRQRLDQLAHAVPEVERLQEEELDDEEADLQWRKPADPCCNWLVSSLGPKIICKPSKVVMRSLSCCNSDDFFLSIDAKQHRALAFIQKMKGRPAVVQARQQTSLISSGHGCDVL